MSASQTPGGTSQAPATASPTNRSGDELAGEVAIVTGGSRGIGAAVARALAQGGAQVAVAARNGEAAATTAAELEGEGHSGHACDVADPAACRALASALQRAGKPASILVNNAGIARDGILLRLRDEDWSQVLDTNLRGAFNMIRAVARGMMKRRGGAIVNVSSVIGLMGNPGQANYAASKAGLHGLTKAVAKELASRNVRCNAVAPGFVRTDMTAGLADAQVAELRGRIPLARLGEPDDVAGLVRFLVGPEAHYITGQVIAVDGGMAM